MHAEAWAHPSLPSGTPAAANAAQAFAYAHKVAGALALWSQIRDTSSRFATAEETSHKTARAEILVKHACTPTPPVLRAYAILRLRIGLTNSTSTKGSSATPRPITFFLRRRRQIRATEASAPQITRNRRRIRIPVCLSDVLVTCKVSMAVCQPRSVFEAR